LFASLRNRRDEVMVMVMVGSTPPSVVAELIGPAVVVLVQRGLSAVAGVNWA
jgi:hypothetical protein